MFFVLLALAAGVMAQKPVVWVISDGGDGINDPDDISAVAGYLLMSNMFDTRAIVMASTFHHWHKDTEDQGEWARRTYGKAYAADLPNLNKYIGGYQDEIRFMESSFKGHGDRFQWQASYDLKDYPSTLALFREVDKSDEVVNVLCFGPLTEQAVLVSYCVENGRQDILDKIRFISHWTSSNFHTGNLENPEHTHNCWADGISCDYMKKMALNGTIKFFECGGIGQYGIVEAGPKGKEYYDRFKSSHLGKIFAEGKFNKNRVDDSDCATYWVLLGNYGVSLNDIASNGLNYPEVEKRNEEAFALHARDMRDEVLRRSNAAAGLDPNAIKVDLIVPEHGMADPHAWVQNDTVFIICGHDEPAEGMSFRMDRWEIWSSTDLRTWNYHRDILPTQTYIGDQPNCWAGDICERDGKYYWYFSNRNINTGVVVADKIDGEYRDLLGKPLLPNGIVPVHPYDPEIYMEDGVYTICFGSGTYYMATLGEDMMSLATEPKAILVRDKEGNRVSTSDKSTLFKRGEWYYLVYGHKYAMSKDLYGPYTFMGKFLYGGHTSFFTWHGQLYVLQENHDLSGIHRGASLKPVFFNGDGTIIVPPDDRWFPGPGRPWRFERSSMLWKSTGGTSLYWNNGILGGNLSRPGAIIQSPSWLFTDTEECSEIQIRMKNSSFATRMRIAIFTRDTGKGFWQSATEAVDWDEQEWITVPISSNDMDFVTYTLPLSSFREVNEKLMQVAVQPAVDTWNGTWEIDEIVVK